MLEGCACYGLFSLEELHFNRGLMKTFSIFTAFFHFDRALARGVSTKRIEIEYCFQRFERRLY